MILRLLIILISAYGVFGENDGYCALYRGEICKNYINSTQFVWYVKYMNGTTKGDTHELITTSLWNELIVTLKEPCRSAAEVIYFLLLLFHNEHCINFFLYRNCYVCMLSHTVIVICFDPYHYVMKTALLLKNSFATMIGHTSKIIRRGGSSSNPGDILNYLIVICYQSLKL